MSAAGRGRGSGGRDGEAAASSELLVRLRAELAGVADGRKAAEMQRYMRSDMPFHGVPAPQAQAVFKRIFADYAIAAGDEERFWADVLGLWRGAAYREERYGAITLTGDRRARPFQTPAALPHYAELITTGAWWDYVDVIASHRLGPILKTHPQPVAKVMRAWSHDDDLWKRRSAILCQLRHRDATDRRLLADCIEPSLSARDFFLRKGIGWALRELAKHDPDWVIAYVRARRDELSPLSKREALRILVKNAVVAAIP